MSATDQEAVNRLRGFISTSGHDPDSKNIADRCVNYLEDQLKILKNEISK